MLIVTKASWATRRQVMKSPVRRMNAWTRGFVDAIQPARLANMNGISSSQKAVILLPDVRLPQWKAFTYLPSRFDS
jgi:hypothetical protein